MPPAFLLDSDNNKKQTRTGVTEGKSSWSSVRVFCYCQKCKSSIISLFYNMYMKKKNKGVLVERFIVPPFSVFDLKQGYWKDRKRQWLNLGIKSEIGRGGELTFSKSAQPPFIYDLRNKMREKSGVDPTWEEVFQVAKEKGYSLMHGTSIFDPLVCELAYSWFGKHGFKVLDPFCGGSVRGVVAGKVGMNYTGIDLREEQVRANEKQAKEICPKANVRFITGNSADIPSLVGAERYDLVFSCPPYHELEVYSDLEGDISNMDYESFLTAYRTIIKRSVERLNDNRFAVFVISDVRAKNGEYNMLSYETIKAFQDAGAMLWNEIILLNELGGLPIRVTKSMQASRKVGRAHQKVLVFYKGDPRKIKEVFGDVELEEVFKAAA